VTIAAFFVLYLPLVVVGVLSVLVPGDGYHWTLDWYRKVFSDEQVLVALQRSVWIGALSTLISTVIGTSAALALERASFTGKRLLEALGFLPLVIPEIVLGLSLLIGFVLVGMPLGSGCVVLAHVTFSLSYVVLTVRSRLQSFDASVEEAALDLGATPWQVFTHVTLPIIFPSILSGALIAFTLSFDDFLITFFTAGVGSDTLPLHIYSMIKFGISPEIHALSTLMIAGTLGLILLFFRRENA
jgi:spermidine/putrescine transport system permease protein